VPVPLSPCAGDGRHRKAHDEHGDRPEEGNSLDHEFSDLSRVSHHYYAD
jgi:hypothetical protein